MQTGRQADSHADRHMGHCLHGGHNEVRLIKKANDNSNNSNDDNDNSDDDNGGY